MGNAHKFDGGIVIHKTAIPQSKWFVPHHFDSPLCTRGPLVGSAALLYYELLFLNGGIFICLKCLLIKYESR